ncbi:hypothetical protein E4T47_00769 [Aureobasidium subglaciale]|nr:hypothetical protein E4T47_00769 [Aureobasidium subglaciale]
MVCLTFPILFIVTLCTLLLTTPVLAESENDWQNYKLQCLLKDHGILQAADRLCNRDLHVPSGVFDGWTYEYEE